jgi:hypothetical protein
MNQTPNESRWLALQTECYCIAVTTWASTNPRWRAVPINSKNWFAVSADYDAQVMPRWAPVPPSTEIMEMREMRDLSMSQAAIDLKWMEIHLKWREIRSRKRKLRKPFSRPQPQHEEAPVFSCPDDCLDDFSFLYDEVPPGAIRCSNCWTLNRDDDDGPGLHCCGCYQPLPKILAFVPLIRPR